MHALQELISRLGRLPGLGPRSSRRIALHLIKKRDELLRPLAQTLENAYATIKTCQVCFNIDMNTMCEVCLDESRKASKTLCVVSDVSDLWALERTQSYKGHYHVLGGLLSAVEGVGPNQINLAQLIARLESREYNEVVFAFNATIDAQTTMHYIVNYVKHLSLTFTSLAKGVPLGGELDYLDDATLSVALSGRQSV